MTGVLAGTGFYKVIMSFRLRFLTMITLIAVSFFSGTSIPAQGTTNFAAWKEAKNAEAVHEWTRRLLIRDFRDVSGTAREELLAKTLSALKDIASDSDVVPSTRYNAVLTAGQLVSKEASQGNLPEAYADALPYLIDLYQGADSPYYLKYGALLGIVRHAICGIDSLRLDQVIDLFLETITTEYAVSEVAMASDFATPLEPAVWDWFRQTALDGLSALKTTGTNGNVVAALLSVIDRKTQEIEIRCSSTDSFVQGEWEQVRRAIKLASKAAKTLGDLDYTSSTDIDAKTITDTFITLVKAVCDAEYKIAVDAVDQKRTSPDPTILIEQIVIDMKTCTQSVAWGIRCAPLPFSLTSRPADSSLYASLKNDDPATKRLERLMSEIIEHTTFLDEGDKMNRQAAVAIQGTVSGESTGANVPKRGFKFDIMELRDALAKLSEALSDIQRGKGSPEG